MLSVPWADVQRTILVPWEGIVLQAILAPLVCHYGVVMGNYLSLQPLPCLYSPTNDIRNSHPKLLVGKKSSFACLGLIVSLF